MALIPMDGILNRQSLVLAEILGVIFQRGTILFFSVADFPLEMERRLDFGRIIG